MALSKAMNEIAEDIQRGAIPTEPWSVDTRRLLASHLRCISSIYEDVLKAERGDCGVDSEHVLLRVRTLIDLEH